MLIITNATITSPLVQNILNYLSK